MSQVTKVCVGGRGGGGVRFSISLQKPMHPENLVVRIFVGLKFL